MHSQRIILFLLLLLLTVNPAAQATVSIVNGAIPTIDAAQTGEDLKTIETTGATSSYTDYPLGYRISYPKHMRVDVSLSAIRSVFSDDKTRIEVYYDNLTEPAASANEYIHYGRRFADNSKDHTIQMDKTFWQRGAEVHLLKWARRPLSRIVNDKRFYATAEIIKNEREVYTIFIKSTEPIVNEMDIISSFHLIKQSGSAGIYLPISQAVLSLNQETRDFYHTYFAETSPLRWGIFQVEAPEVMHHLQTIEQKIDYRFPFLVRYQPLGDDVPLIGLNIAYSNRKYVELTLQTYFYDRNNTSVMYDILDGKYDDYFLQYAKGLKLFAHPVLFRLNNEMNGDWCWYSSFHTGKDTEIYKSVWRYIHKLFDQEGVNNVLWVWNPHDRSFPNFSWNHYLTYYPGDDVVDIVGITGYNTGNYFPGETWRDFREIYTPLYREYTSIFNKPLMITEFGASSFGGDKPAWIKQMFLEMKQFERIKVAIWWSGIDWDSEGRAGRIYRLDENESVLEAFREGLKPYQEK